MITIISNPDRKQWFFSETVYVRTKTVENENAQRQTIRKNFHTKQQTRGTKKKVENTQNAGMITMTNDLISVNNQCQKEHKSNVQNWDNELYMCAHHLTEGNKFNKV